MDTTTEPRSARHGGGADRAETYLSQIRNILAWMLVLWVVSVAAAAGVGVYLGSHSAQDGTSQTGIACQPAGTINPC